MSRLEKLKEKARTLEARDPKGAIEAWLEALKTEEGEGEANPDLSVYNRIGDLWLKIKDPAQAADYYERAVDKYAELGFHNNAIAMCNKVLRNAPGRPTAYLKLAKLYASKGFLAEAKQNFVEYAERMHKLGKIQHAFAALKEFTDLSPEGGGLRDMLEEQLNMYGAPNRPGPERASAPAAPKGDAADGKTGKGKTSSLVFLDLDAPPTKAKPVVAPRPTPPRAPEPPPVTSSLLTDVSPDLDTSLEIETTSLAEGQTGEVDGGMVEGLERTANFGDDQSAGPVPSLRDDESVDDVEPLADFEATAPTEDVTNVEDDAETVVDLEPLVESELEIEPPPAPPRRPFRPGGPTAGAPQPPPSKVAPVVPRRPGAPPPNVSAPSGAAPKVSPVMPKRPTPPAPPPKRAGAVEVPLLELEPDFESAATGAGHDVDDEPLAGDQGAKGFVQTEFTQGEQDAAGRPGRRSGFIDLGLDEVSEDQPGSVVFANVEAAPLPPSIEQLEALVADDPDDPEAHRALGEALIEAGDRERGIEELDHATAGFENRGALGQAQDLTGEILRLDPNSVRHRQKLVEYAFKSGDKARLIDAYLELADTLLRGDLPDKARAVYQRVAEHDRTNERAKAALAMLAPVTAPAPEPKARSNEPRVAPKDAKMTVRDEPGESGDFVDLGAMILEGEGAVTRNTRMTVADEEPTGDEEKDFRDMLARFKQGIDENIEETDFQSHYDLGVAFKEMGLLDEAIAEFQKALAAPEGKLRTTEALGACFIERRAYVVAESILRRGLELPASGDKERLGVLYWLARALEELGKKVEARELYGRVFAVDIRFMDVGERVKALAKAK